MKKFMMCRLILFCAWFVLVCTATQKVALADEGGAFIDDNEEYAVIAAVLFPQKTDASSRAKNPSAAKNNTDKSCKGLDCPPPLGTDSKRRQLDGIPFDHHNLSRTTSATILTTTNSDQGMISEHNRKNMQNNRIDRDKLLAESPQGISLTLVTPPQISKKRELSEIRFGVTYVSRPGFNPVHSRAVMQVSHVADYEMGVGYIVYLEKSSQDGLWSISDVFQNRIY